MRPQTETPRPPILGGSVARWMGVVDHPDHRVMNAAKGSCGVSQLTTGKRGVAPGWRVVNASAPHKFSARSPTRAAPVRVGAGDVHRAGHPAMRGRLAAVRTS